MRSLWIAVRGEVTQILVILAVLVLAIGLALVLGFEDPPEPEPVTVTKTVTRSVTKLRVDTITVQPPAGVCWSVEPEADVCTYLIETR